MKRALVVAIIALLILLFVRRIYSDSDIDGWKEEDSTAANELYGKVDFPNSCLGEASSEVNKGVAVLHSFWYWRAFIFFENATFIDPNCAIGYWGMAMSNWTPLWPQPDESDDLVRGQVFLSLANRIPKPAASEREWMFIHALGEFYGHNVSDNRSDEQRVRAYSHAMGRLYHNRFTYNDTVDTDAFYALSLITIAERFESDEESARLRKNAAEILSEAMELNPEHPAVYHYTIHAFDTNELAESGISAADAYTSIVPDIPHALHMPSHIYIRLGYWIPVINNNLQSMVSAEKWCQWRKAVEVIDSEYTHALSFASYGWLQLGKYRKPAESIKKVTALLKRLIRYGVESDELIIMSSDIVDMQCVYLLETENYDEAAAMRSFPLFGNLRNSPNIRVHYTRVVGNAMLGNFDQLDQEITWLQRANKTLYGPKSVKGNLDIETMIEDQMLIMAATAWRYFSHGDLIEAVMTMHDVVDFGDNYSQYLIPIIAPREILAFMQEANEDYQTAMQTYYYSYKKDFRGRLRSIYGIAESAQHLGDIPVAEFYYQKFLEQCHDCKRAKLPSQSLTKKAHHAKNFLHKIEKDSSFPFFLLLGLLVFLVGLIMATICCMKRACANSLLATSASTLSPVDTNYHEIVTTTNSTVERSQLR